MGFQGDAFQDDAFQVEVAVAPAEPANPEVFLEISYLDPDEEPVWEVETAYLRRFSIGRGRSTEDEQPNAGTATIVLDNRDGRFNPLNETSPHYPNVVPMRRVRLYVLVDTGAVPFTMRRSTLRGGATLRAGVNRTALFTGFIEGWNQEWERTDHDAWVTVRAVDGLKRLAGMNFRWGFGYLGPEETPDWELYGHPPSWTVAVDAPPYPPDDPSGERIRRVLAAVAWPEVDRDLDPGTVTILGSEDSIGGEAHFEVDEQALSYIASVVRAEGGAAQFYCNTEGIMVYRDATYDPPLRTDEIYGDIDGEIRYHNITVAPFDESIIRNVVTVTDSLIGINQRVVDDDSIARYWERAYTVQIAPRPTGWDELAEEYLARYKDPHLRISALVFRPKTTLVWRRLLAHDLGELVRVRRRPVSGELIDQISRIEGISIVANNKFDWQLSWQLSSVEDATS